MRHAVTGVRRSPHSNSYRAWFRQKGFLGLGKIFLHGRVSRRVRCFITLFYLLRAWLQGLLSCGFARRLRPLARKLKNQEGVL